MTLGDHFGHWQKEGAVKRAIVIMCLFGLVVASVPAAAVMEFRKVDYFEVVTKDNGESDEKKRDARMEIDQDEQLIWIVHEKDGASKATYAEIPFADVTSIVYERAKSPRVKTAIFLSPLALFSSGKKHWLTIEYEGGYAYMRLDKNNQRQIRAALGAAGFEVETIIED